MRSKLQKGIIHFAIILIAVLGLVGITAVASNAGKSTERTLSRLNYYKTLCAKQEQNSYSCRQVEKLQKRLNEQQGAGTAGSSGFHIPIRDSSIYPFGGDPAKIENYKNNVRGLFPNSLIDADCNGKSCWEWVIETSVNAQVNPSFVLAIWREESAFSHVGDHFGCLDHPHTRDGAGVMDALSNCFIPFVIHENPNSVEGFYAAKGKMCGPNQAVLCSNNPNFLHNLEKAYNELEPAVYVRVVPAGNLSVRTYCSTSTGKDRAVFSWKQASGNNISAQWLDFALNENLDYGLQARNVTNRSSVTITDIAPGIRYWWRINTQDSSGNWYSSNVASFESVPCSTEISWSATTSCDTSGNAIINFRWSRDDTGSPVYALYRDGVVFNNVNGTSYRYLAPGSDEGSFHQWYVANDAFRIGSSVQQIQTPICDQPVAQAEPYYCKGDFNNNGKIDEDDIKTVQANYFSTNLIYDINDDAKVNGTDINTLVSNINKPC